MLGDIQADRIGADVRPDIYDENDPMKPSSTSNRPSSCKSTSARFPVPAHARAEPSAACPFRHAASPSVRIGERDISTSASPYVIAEAGVNHDGDLNTAKALIEAAHEVGADVVKFQCFVADRLVDINTPQCSYQQTHAADVSQHAMLKRLELTIDDFAALRDHARHVGIEFFATPFGLGELSSLTRLGVRVLKIASPDIVNVPLIDAAAKSGLPVILSTGAADESEVDAAVARFDQVGAHDRLILLHCVSTYPTPIAGARLRCISTLRDRYQVLTGVSDHTADVETAALAVAAGAVVLEKHLTLSRSRSGPDHFFSLEPGDFARYVAGARSAHGALGDGELAATPDQREVQMLARGRIVAVAAIPAGSRLTADVLAVRRPGTGMSPLLWDFVIGRTARIAIPAGAALSPEMLR